MSMHQQDERADILRVLDAYHAAMVDAQTAALDSLLEPTFELVHITGYVQPKAEWLSVVRSGEFDYHAIQLDHSSLRVEVAPGSVLGAGLPTAVLRGRGVFNATISGMKNPWRLQFTLQLVKHPGAWRVAYARYTGY